MVSTSHALKIFWPSHLCIPNSQPGYLIGWQNNPWTFCVAALVQDIKLKDLKRLVQDFCTSDDIQHFQRIYRVCKARPTLLGELVTTRPNKPSSPLDAECWLTMLLDDAYIPIPISLSTRGKTIALSSYQIMFYEQPNPERLQFLALEPLALDITPKQHHQQKQHRSMDNSTALQRQTALTLQNLAKSIDVEQRILGLQNMETSDDLTSVLVQINSSYYLEHGILHRKKHQDNQDRQQQSYQPRHWSNIFQYSFIRQGIFLHPLRKLVCYLQRLIKGPLLCFVFLLLCLAEITIHVLSLQLPKIHVAMKDLSAAGQQIDLRLQQLYFWPRQYMMLRKRNRANTAETRAYYISFYNSMWLVANDIIIGVAIGSYLMNNRDIVSNKLHDVLKTYTVESLQSMMYWFLETPAGLKLNTQLGTFLSELFLWLIHLWTECMTLMEPWTPRIIYMIGGSGIFGVSMIIALLSDMLACMTMQIYCFYMVAARIFNWQLITLYALFNLFRGKKRNMLRNRIDSCDYDLDQLLLGTCLFTLLTFLFPTVLIYYLTFALSRVSVIFLQAIMETLLAFFNHFPLFAIMLRIKDPDRVPGGLCFDLFQYDTFLYKHHWFRQTWLRWTHQQQYKENRIKHHRRLVRFQLPNDQQKRRQQKEQQNTPEGTYLWIKNTPIPFGAIFFQYMLLWKRLSAHYFSTYVFQCLLYGEPIKPIPKLQYPMLPDNRPSLKSAWKMLKTMWNK
ncbi:N-acetylglucosaminyl transferase component-domain-containing protein [Halteromyces radiatus]|uniref:N-acetylglucosaminyl transferase component-domain-containing protein n=1 Tax=Halteromyces radiatus TaxID=101107 RepID=UPI00221F0AAA|nr:N-acetylglucosaminyl transferase component-domain-containing protein [Halteromyces radiatus]KAI8086766.1 N-acetylglucosaminyl transferase component-domain-containing protein [Halteromyces radiatus]